MLIQKIFLKPSSSAWAAEFFENGEKGMMVI